MLRVLILVLVAFLVLILLGLGLRWLWRTAFGQEEEIVTQSVQAATWQDRLVKILLTLLILIGVLLFIDRLTGPDTTAIRHYQPATLDDQGRISNGKTY